MIRVSQIKLRPGHTKEELLFKTAKLLKVAPEEIEEFHIVKQSIDARKKPDIFFSYTVDVRTLKDKQIRAKKEKINGQISFVEPVIYRFPESGEKKLSGRPVIIGTGPAGLFCGYFLAKRGYCPILLERGKAVEERQKDVEAFWQKGILNPDSNVQFGEGGAGTFSDGKLNTLIKDKDGRNRKVLEVFVSCGAKESILYENKPHIGTDVVCRVVGEMRRRIMEWGGEVRFESKVTDVRTVLENGERRIEALCVNDREWIQTPLAVLAIGHSARDTFEMLYERQLPMQAKAFAVGFRVEHKQSIINQSQYGRAQLTNLPQAAYKVTASTKGGRGVYSFCMCPGGYVVDASSEEGRLAVNGMSYSGRDGENANSAIIVAVTPEDFESEHPLAGIRFQRTLEERAYCLAEGKVPVQRYGDFKNRITGQETEQDVGEKEDTPFLPQIKGRWKYADISTILPMACNEAFVEGMEHFGGLIQGFNAPEVLLSGVESRTSSPVRIHRDESLQSCVRGLYPCGEGAGYAGGITSAAMDGMRVAEEIAREYAPVMV